MQTKYSELPDEVKLELEKIEKQIQAQIQESSLIANRSMEAPLKEVAAETELTHRNLIDLKNTLKRDSFSIEKIKSAVAKELRHSDLIARFVDSTHNDFTSKSMTNDQYSKMTECRQHIEELELHIRNTTRPDLSPNMLEEVIRNQYNAFLAIASRVAVSHDQVEKCKRIFEEQELKYGMKQERSTQLGKESFSQMASLLVPSGQSNVNQNTLGSFGASSTQQTGFGANTNQQNKFGTSTGLFGSSTAAPTTATSFGATPAQSTGLFGNATPAATGNSLFGKSTTPAASNLFGTTTPAANSGGSLFGNTAVQNNQTLFGGASTTTNTLFGNTSTPAAKRTHSQ